MNFAVPRATKCKESKKILPESWKNLKESWSPEEACCHSDSWERPSAKAGGENSQEVKKCNNNNTLGFWDTNGTPNLGQTTRPDLAIVSKTKTKEKKLLTKNPAHHKVKLKESKKNDKYLDLMRKLKIKWNIKMTLIPIVIGAVGTISKGLIKGLENL